MPWSKVQLTPIDESHIDQIMAWQNDPGIRDLTMGARFPVQRDAVKEWLKNLREQNAKSVILFAIVFDGSFVGTVKFHHLDLYQRKAMLGIFIGSPAERGKGIGEMATSLMLDYGFNALDFARIELEVVASNAGAIRLYEKLGFVKEGVKRRDYFADGARHDVVWFGMLKEEWQRRIPSDANRLLHGFSDVPQT